MLHPKQVPTETSVDYDAATLDEIANDINARTERMARDILAIGNALLAARKRFPGDREFGQWRESNVTLSRQTTGRFMQVASSLLVTSGQVIPDRFYYILCNTSAQERAAVLDELTGSSLEDLTAQIKQCKTSIGHLSLRIGTAPLTVSGRLEKRTVLGYSSLNELMATETSFLTPELADEFNLAFTKWKHDGKLNLDGVHKCLLKGLERAETESPDDTEDEEQV